MTMLYTLAAVALAVLIVVVLCVAVATLLARHDVERVLEEQHGFTRAEAKQYIRAARRYSKTGDTL